MGGKEKRKEIERLLKLKEERPGGKEVLSRLLGETPEVPGKPEERKAGLLFPEVKGKVEKVLDRYGMAEILKLEGESLPLYRLRIPELTQKEKEFLALCKKKAVEEIKIDPDSITDPSERRRVFMQELMKILERESKGMRLPSGRLKELSELAFHDMIGYGPLDYLIADDRLEDILVIGVNKPVYVYHSKYGMCSTNIVFEDEDTIRYYIDKMARLVGRRIDHQMPLLDARLPDGSRINATIPPVSLEGPTLSIRKFRKDPLTVVDLMNFGTLSPEVGAFLWLLVHGLDVKPANILFSGGTGSGKTTLLNAATTFVPAHERIISIEDTAELQLPHPHWVRLETRPPNIEGRGEITMDDLVKNALRMRPDRIVVGEVRGPEARTMFTAMNTGHDGCMGTLHANSAAETITRLTEPPMSVPPIMIPALDVIVMLQRIYHRQKGHIRRITEIAEITGLEGGKPQLSRIFKWNPRTDKVEPTGVPLKFRQVLSELSGRSGTEIELELKRRAMVLEWMRQKGIRNVFEVGKVIQEYYQDPEGLLKKVKGG